MKKILILIFSVFILSGCATYKFQKSDSAKPQGYLVSYDGKPLPEYTIGKDNVLPDLTLAEQRFKRRRAKVEYYYKKMGQIESRLKYFFWDPPAMMVDFIGGIFRWPFIARADYKYNRDPKYKERVDRLDEQKDELEKARVNALKEKLAAYVAADLNKESPTSPVAQEVAPLPAAVEPVAAPAVETVVAPVAKPTAVPAPVVEPVAPQVVEPTVAPIVASVVVPAAEAVVSPTVEPVAVTPAAVKEEVVEPPAIEPVVVAQPPVEAKPVIVEKAPVIKISVAPPVAVITAKPIKGYSPLKVNFSGQKSYSKGAKIVAYNWDFGDGDTSNKKKVENTYWSTTFGSRSFTATLTVKDDAGNTSSASTIIEVITK